MKRTIAIAMFTTLTALLLFAMVFQPMRLNAQRNVDREYKVVLIMERGTQEGTQNIEMQVNAHAKGGWRLVAVSDHRYVFERGGK